jgi:signal transduction histidine kinase
MGAGDDALNFPDAPRGRLDKAITELVEQAGEVLETQGRLRALLRANHAIVENLELSVVLRRIVESAVELVGARYGALGVISPFGTVDEFVHVGAESALAEQPGTPLVGAELLSSLLDDARPIRLSHNEHNGHDGHDGHDAGSSGHPEKHPVMESFLGVPIRVHDEVFGNLYLTDSANGDFSLDDEQLLSSLAETAGFAIENARLFAETQRRQAWAAASAEVTAAMLSASPEDAISILASRMIELAEADVVWVIVGTGNPDLLRISSARGIDADEINGTTFPPRETLARSVLEGGQPLLVNDGSGTSPLPSGATLGPILAVPIVASGVTDGVFVVGRIAGGRHFTPADLEMAADFAGQASVGLEVVRARDAQQSMLLADDRARIARDLHDHVIQQLFGTGLDLQSVATAMNTPALSRRVTESVSHLDEAIAQIRTVIFALTPTSGNSHDSVRHRLIDLAGEVAPAFPTTPSVSFAGPVDLAIDAELAEDIFAVAREALTNAGKHAGAEHSALSLSVTDENVVLDVSDNGSGIRSDRRSGLANLQARAHKRGGSLEITTGVDGTLVRWAVPIDDGRPA